MSALLVSYHHKRKASNGVKVNFISKSGSPTTITSGLAKSVREEDTHAVLKPFEHEERMKRKIALRESVMSENMKPRDLVTVRVPATSANMGPGFDCLGCAVDNMWSELTVERSSKFEIVAYGDGADAMPKDQSNYVCVGLKAAFEIAGKEVPLLKYTINSQVPFARGLGSSSAAIVGGIIAGLVLAGHKLPCWGSEALLQIASKIEGHPDNVAPAIYGGIQLGIDNGERWLSERIPTPPGVQMVMFIPNFIGKTSDARNALGPNISRKEAAFNIGRVAYLVNGLNHGNLDCLKHGCEDALHQPQRGKAIYHYLYPMIEAAEAAGANACYLSGAGPTVMALTSGASGDIFTQHEKELNHVEVAKAMKKSARESGIDGRVVVTNICNEGAKVIRVEPPFSSEENGVIYKDGKV
ncbi:hypothetical protein TrCOL_g13668 [Triparma columacea]|uniref:Homoserine kinase n=1 Tax=Triparma columacea TaxID=722753 RepID=A0A9W7G1D0_9STRA|nr:hypothetical protein TrCOL_g13668 [Triparma columacea]